MLMPDPSIKPPVDTGEKTISGRTIWNDPETGEDYSERSTTFEIEGKHYTMPTVSEDGRQHSDDQIRDYVKEYGPVDYLTGEELPEFKSREDAIQYAISRSDTRKPKDMARGGIMNDQMRMFEEGGIADDGMERDPVSGNEVPSGSLAKEVRDDIPAQLSEGEYVVPADVVRYFGVRVFEEMRNEAKMGLQGMERDGRIGGEPIMPEAMPEADQNSISEEDLAEIEQMLTTGVANGGLMDKIAYVAANDPVINKAFNNGGAVVSFAVGGMAQSAYGDPTRVDEVIGKFMQMTQNKPQIMDELSKRGIRINRTGAEQEPQQMKTDNSSSKTTEPVFKGQPSPAQEPIKAAAGVLAGPTMPLPAGFQANYAVPGMSLTNVVPSIQAPAPVVAAPPPVDTTPVGPTTGSIDPCAAAGMVLDPITNTCVPRQNNNNDNNPGDAPKPPEFKFKAPDKSKNYFKMTRKELQTLGKAGEDAATAADKAFNNKALGIAAAAIGGPIAAIGTLLFSGYKSIQQSETISSLRAAAMVAKARGFDAEATALENKANVAAGNASFIVQGINKFGGLSGQNDFFQQIAAFGTKDQKLDESQYSGLALERAKKAYALAAERRGNAGGALDLAAREASRMKKEVDAKLAKPKVTQAQKDSNISPLTSAAGKVQRDTDKRNRDRSSTQETTAQMAQRISADKAAKQSLSQTDKVSLASNRAAATRAVKANNARLDPRNMAKGGLMKRKKK